MEGARQLGFEFRGRTRSHLTVAFQGREVGVLQEHTDISLISAEQTERTIRVAVNLPTHPRLQHKHDTIFCKLLRASFIEPRHRHPCCLIGMH